MAQRPYRFEIARLKRIVTVSCADGIRNRERQSFDVAGFKAEVRFAETRRETSAHDLELAAFRRQPSVSKNAMIM